MEGPHAGISNVEAHVHQLEQRLEDCLAIKANSDDVPSTSQVTTHHACRGIAAVTAALLHP